MWTKPASTCDVIVENDLLRRHVLSHMFIEPDAGVA